MTQEIYKILWPAIDHSKTNLKSKMSNFIKLFTLAVGLLALSFTATAQGSFDMYGAPRYLVIDAGTTITNASGTGNSSNAPVDIHGFEGNGAVVFTATSTGTSPKIY